MIKNKTLFKKFSKKYLGTSIASLSLIGLLLFTPTRANAQFTDFTNLIQNTVTAVSSVTTKVFEGRNIIKDFVLEPAVKATSRAILKNLDHQLISWVNNGYKGNGSFFVQNEQSYLKGLGDQQAMNFVNDILDPSMTAAGPYARGTAQQLIKQYVGQYNTGAYKPVVFTMDKIIGPNWRDFQNDFTVGGWNGFMAMNLVDGNNPAGSYLTQGSQLSKQVGDSRQNAVTNLNQNDGFLSDTACDTYSEVKSNKAKKKESEADSATVDNGINNAKSDDNDWTNNIQVDDLLQDYCTHDSTKTPGSVIKSQLTEALKSPSDLLKNSDKIGDLISNAMTALFSDLINKGLSKIGDKIPANTKPDTDISQKTAKVLDNFVNGTDGVSTWATDADIVTTPVDFTKSINDAITKTTTLRDIYKSQDGILTGIPQALWNLDMCVPGPELGYQDRLRTIIAKQDARLSEGKSQDRAQGLYELNNRIETFFKTMEMFMIGDQNVPHAVEMISMINNSSRLIVAGNQASDNFMDTTLTLSNLKSMKSTVDSLCPKPENCTNKTDSLTTVFKKFLAIKDDVPENITIQRAQNDLTNYQSSADQISDLSSQCAVGRSQMAHSPKESYAQSLNEKERKDQNLSATGWRTWATNAVEDKFVRECDALAAVADDVNFDLNCSTVYSGNLKNYNALR